MTWEEIPGWFDWELFYQDVVRLYPGGILVEVGTYLGRSLCYLGQLVKASGKPFSVVGVDWCVGSGVEHYPNGEGRDNHAEAVQEGLGTFAGTLHRNVMDCGLADVVSILVADSLTASKLFTDKSLTGVFLDAKHDYNSVCADIRAWLPKIKLGGFIAGDDMGDGRGSPVWPEVERAVRDCLPNFHQVAHDSWLYYRT